MAEQPGGHTQLETCILQWCKNTQRYILMNNENLLNLCSLRETFLVSLVYRINTERYSGVPELPRIRLKIFETLLIYV